MVQMQEPNYKSMWLLGLVTIPLGIIVLFLGLTKAPLGIILIAIGGFYLFTAIRKKKGSKEK